MTKTPAKTHGEEYERFGRNLASMRNKLGLSQSEIAERLNMTQSAYAGYETGTRKIPLSLIVQLSNFFNIPADELIGVIPVSTSCGKKDNSDNSEKHLVDTYRKLSNEGRQKLLERADELFDLGYVEKGDAKKMA